MTSLNKKPSKEKLFYEIVLKNNEIIGRISFEVAKTIKEFMLLPRDKRPDFIEVSDFKMIRLDWIVQLQEDRKNVSYGIF